LGRMVKCVLIQSSSSIYDDEAGKHYHFPKAYLNRIEEASGDWAVFYSPVKDSGVSPENRGSYFATAQLGKITLDLSKDGHFYVEILDGTYASFSSPVSRRHDGHFIEKALEGNSGRANSGVSQNSVRHISDEEFSQIISLAWLQERSELPRRDIDASLTQGFDEGSTPFQFDVEREIVQTLLNRKVRDDRFRHAILTAYGKRCAITGWTFINGGGRAEVEAAHIKPVELNGPDSINNGVALSGTIHWMFDRGLIGIAANDDILISRKVNDPEAVKILVNSTGKLIRPERPEHQPHPAFLKWHRRHHRFEAA